MTSAAHSRVSYPGIDAVKLFMALVVVEIHADPLGHLGGFAGRMLATVENVAVPFFFIASGFLCFRGLSASDVAGPDAPKLVRVRKTFLKLMRLYAIWTLVYLPVSVFGYWLQGCGPAEAVVLWLRGVLLVGEAAFSWPLWYLLAAAIGFALVYLILQGGGSPRHVLTVSLCVMLAGWGISTLHGWDGAPVFLSLPVKVYFAMFVTVRNGLFLGFFYIALGMVFGLRSDSLTSLRLSAVLATFVVGVAGCLLVSPAQNLLFCAITASGIFLLSARVVSDSPGFKLVRNLSTVVYLTHMIFIVVLAYGLFGGQGPVLSSCGSPMWAVYLLTLVCSIGFGLLVIGAARSLPCIAGLFGL